MKILAVHFARAYDSLLARNAEYARANKSARVRRKLIAAYIFVALHERSHSVGVERGIGARRYGHTQRRNYGKHTDRRYCYTTKNFPDLFHNRSIPKYRELYPPSQCVERALFSVGRFRNRAVRRLGAFAFRLAFEFFGGFDFRRDGGERFTAAQADGVAYGHRKRYTLTCGL